MKWSKSFTKTITLSLFFALGLQTTAQAGWFSRITQSAFSLFGRNSASIARAAKPTVRPLRLPLLTGGRLAFGGLAMTTAALIGKEAYARRQGATTPSQKFSQMMRDTSSWLKQSHETKKKKEAEISILPSLGEVAFGAALSARSHMTEKGLDGAGLARSVAESTASSIVLNGIKKTVKDTPIDVFSCSCRPDHSWGCWLGRGALGLGLNIAISSYIVGPTFSAVLGDKPGSDGTVQPHA